MEFPEQVGKLVLEVDLYADGTGRDLSLQHRQGFFHELVDVDGPGTGVIRVMVNVK